MKGSLFLGALCVFGAVASPIDKRVVIVTDTVVDDVVVTVTGGPATTSSSISTAAPVVYTTAVVVEDAGPAEVNNVAAPSTSSSISTTQPTVAPTTSVAPTTTSAVQTSSSTSETASGSAAYQTMILNAHNIHRANHSASDLTWNETLAESALALANTCNYGHNEDLGPATNYGQNIGFGIAADKVDEMITNLMYNDEMMYYQGLYGEATPSMANFDSWGHFSQIVWAETTSVGCATVTCDPLTNSGSDMSLPYTVCDYYPSGMPPISLVLNRKTF